VRVVDRAERAARPDEAMDASHIPWIVPLPA
jgi:hypothetical protein